MNSKTKQFVEYLLYIGISTKETIGKLLEIIDMKVKSLENEKINQNDLMKAIMVEYIKTFNEDGLEKLAENIFLQYNKNKLITITKYLSRIITINQTQEIRRVNQYFDYWKNKTFNEFLYKQKSLSLRQSKSEKKYLKSNSIADPEIISRFFIKLDDYQNRKENSKKKLIKEKDKENLVNCTFSPNLNLTKKKYANVKSRVNSSGYNSTSDALKNFADEKPQKKFNKNTINKLYNDYQRRNAEKEILQKNIYKENGYTFTPKLNLNNKYAKNIKDNFLERNRKMLEEKKEFIASFNYLRNMEIKGNDIHSISENILKKK